MSSFLALYRGDSIGSSKLVAVSADPATVSEFAERLLRQPINAEREPDPVLLPIERGRRRALRVVAREGKGLTV